MKKTLLLIILILFVRFNFLHSQQFSRPEYKNYVETYIDVAVNEMLLYNIPASITLAQGILESNSGRSLLATEANNHFGIKCHEGWLGETYTYDDDKKGECFRKYKSATESFRDHSLFLTTRPRYSNLFALPLTDYKGWANGLKLSGYATNPNYANILIRIIEENSLMIFDDTVNVYSFERLVRLQSDETRQSAVVTPDISPETDKDKSAPKHPVEEPTYDKELFTDYIGKILFYENYVQPNPEDFQVVYISKTGRNVYRNYGVPFIFAEKGDTWESIAKEFNIWASQVYKQNDLARNDKITEGQILYLEKKNNRRVTFIHEVKEGETMYSISQEKCIKLKKLYKYNKIHPGIEPNPGTKIYLRR
ncbi:MAG: glucosaminidase domain-containing protein [Bacteroidales bacterium]|jgi:hypothetical protein